MPSQDRRRYASGAVMTVAGLAAMLEAYSFGLGTAARMGPGLYPTAVGAALALVGVLIALAPDRLDGHEAETFGRPQWRGWFCIIAGVLSFIVLGQYLGLGPATFACVFVSACGDRRNGVTTSLALAFAATLTAAVVFSWLLNFQMPFLTW